MIFQNLSILHLSFFSFSEHIGNLQAFLKTSNIKFDVTCIPESSESIWKKVKGTAIKALRSDVGKFYQNYYNILQDCLLKVFQKPKTDLIAT